MPNENLHVLWGGQLKNLGVDGLSTCSKANGTAFVRAPALAAQGFDAARLYDACVAAVLANLNAA